MIYDYTRDEIVSELGFKLDQNLARKNEKKKKKLKHWNEMKNNKIVQKIYAIANVYKLVKKIKHRK